MNVSEEANRSPRLSPALVGNGASRTRDRGKVPGEDTVMVVELDVPGGHSEAGMIRPTEVAAPEKPVVVPRGGELPPTPPNATAGAGRYLIEVVPELNVPRVAYERVAVAKVRTHVVAPSAEVEPYLKGYDATEESGVARPVLPSLTRRPPPSHRLPRIRYET